MSSAAKARPELAAVGLADPVGSADEGLAEGGGAVGAPLGIGEAVGVDVTDGDAHAASSSVAATSDKIPRRADDRGNAAAPMGATTGQS